MGFDAGLLQAISQDPAENRRREDGQTRGKDHPNLAVRRARTPVGTDPHAPGFGGESAHEQRWHSHMRA